MKKILIIGKEGQIGWELQRTLSTLGNVIAVSRPEFDLASPDSIVAGVRSIKPDIIVNAAAYTAVDLAEKEVQLANAINGTAPAILAEEAKRLGALLVHYSTDYVFDGTSQQPYLEDDATAPLNVYGHSKRQGELAIQAVGGNYLILRTSWVYGSRGKNFLMTMLRLAKERDHLKIVMDQVGAPTWSRMITLATAHILAQGFQEKSGIYHLTSEGKTSWCDFARSIFKERGPLAATPLISGIPSREYPTPAQRPAFSVLSNDKLLATFGVALPNWEVGLKLCMQEIVL